MKGTRKPLWVTRVRGIKCNMPSCAFRDDSARFSWRWIGAPCPRCGRSLLTIRDYLLVGIIVAVVRGIDGIANLLGLEASPDAKYAPSARIHVNGSAEQSGPKEEAHEPCES